MSNLKCFVLLSLAAAAHAQTRPAITGISHMCVYAGDAAAADNFYGHILGGAKGPDPQDPSGARYYFSSTQFVEVLPLPAGQDINRMACVAYNTADASGLLAYLHARNVAGLGELQTSSDGSRWFQTKDPEGNVVQFIQPGQLIAPGDKQPRRTPSERASSMSAILSIPGPLKMLSIKTYWVSAHTGSAPCIPTMSIGCRNRFPTVTTGSNICSSATVPTFRCPRWTSVS